jgi:hypothetical protein
MREARSTGAKGKSRICSNACHHNSMNGIRAKEKLSYRIEERFGNIKKSYHAHSVTTQQREPLSHHGRFARASFFWRARASKVVDLVKMQGRSLPGLRSSTHLALKAHASSSLRLYPEPLRLSHTQRLDLETWYFCISHVSY